jgi:hypothetical protein
MPRLLFAATVAAAISLTVGGCTANSVSNLATRTTGPSSVTVTPTTGSAGLPDPMPGDLPVGTRILAQRQGAGTTTLDLTGLTGSAKAVNVRWTCVGDGTVKITDGASKTIVGGGCADTVAGATYLGGTVPLSIVSSLRWTLQAGPATHWRIAVTASN